MRLPVLAVVAALAASSCATGPAGPPVVSEQTAISAELAYTAASDFAARRVASGTMTADTFHRLDGLAYAALLAVRAAYAAHDATAYALAAAEFATAVAAFKGA